MKKIDAGKAISTAREMIARTVETRLRLQETVANARMMRERCALTRTELSQRLKRDRF